MKTKDKIKKQRDEKRVFVDDIDIGYLKTMAVIFFKIPISEIDGTSRKWDTKVVRHILMYIAFYNTRLPLKTIGALIGKKDHSSVIHARVANQDRIDIDRKHKERYEEFIDFLGLEKIKVEEAA